MQRKHKTVFHDLHGLHIAEPSAVNAAGTGGLQAGSHISDGNRRTVGKIAAAAQVDDHLCVGGVNALGQPIVQVHAGGDLYQPFKQKAAVLQHERAVDKIRVKAIGGGVAQRKLGSLHPGGACGGFRSGCACVGRTQKKHRGQHANSGQRANAQQPAAAGGTGLGGQHGRFAQ